MRGNGKRRLALLLALVMTGTLLAGGTTLAKEYGYGDKARVEILQPGDIIRNDIIVPGGYKVYENGSEKGLFRNSIYDENGNFQGYDGTYYILTGKEIPTEQGGMMIKSGTIEIKSVDIDETDKTIRIACDYLYEAEGPDEFGFDERYVKAGETVTFTLPGWVDESQFDRWMIKERTADITAELGLTEEQLHGTTISFAMPERDINVQVVLKDNTTVSGNVPVPPSDDTEDNDNNNNDSNNNDSNNGSVSDNQSSGGQSSGSSTSSDSSAAEAPVYAYDRVTGSDGKVLVSTSPLSFYAADIRGAAVVTPKDTVYAAAGLSQEDMDRGTNAKFYVGSPYRKADKDALRQAASKVEGQIASMLTIDLYTITERGWIESVRNLKEGTQEPIKMVLGIPAGAVKEGRTFSLVCLDENGKTVELPDTDSDPNTVTVELSRFGSFALIYK